jgi:hypothetical protein
MEAMLQMRIRCHMKTPMVRTTGYNIAKHVSPVPISAAKKAQAETNGIYFGLSHPAKIIHVNA